ncbi:pre-mrna polyadenylation factor fip1 [Moniliophthora roreri]|nr:pre-mrna polyadenylation factor fip1 [Moniliophthora roreri]
MLIWRHVATNIAPSPKLSTTQIRRSGGELFFVRVRVLRRLPHQRLLCVTLRTAAAAEDKTPLACLWLHSSGTCGLICSCQTLERGRSVHWALTSESKLYTVYKQVYQDCYRGVAYALLQARPLIWRLSPLNSPEHNECSETTMQRAVLLSEMPLSLSAKA